MDKSLINKKKSAKIKFNELLVKKNIAENLKIADAMIIEGKVLIENTYSIKPGMLVEENAKIIIKESCPFVSRGGLKLEGIIKDLRISIKGKNAIDVGSSTGGFIDCLLQKGAQKVIAVDVAYGKLSYKLRSDQRVILLEKTNVRYLDVNKLPFLADLITVDVSFISVKKIFEKIIDMTVKNGSMLLLIKPQFEAERNEVRNKGVIKENIIHEKILNDIAVFVSKYPVFLKSIGFSKIKGAKGNIEFWFYINNYLKQAEYIENYGKIVKEIVEKAHKYFNQ